MQKRILLIILSSFTLFNADAQSLKSFTGGKIDDYTDGMFNLYDYDDTYLYSFRRLNSSYYIDAFDRASLNRSFRVKVPLPSRDSVNYELETLFIRNDTFQVFYSWFNKAESMKKLELITFNKSGESSGSMLIDSSGGKNSKRSGGFSVMDYSKFNEFLSYGYKTERGVSYISIDHFDYSGNRKQSQSLKVPNDDVVEYSVLGDDCSLYHLAHDKRGERGRSWVLNIYSPGSDSSKSIPLPAASQGQGKCILSTIHIRSIFNKDVFWFFTPWSTYTNNKAQGLYILGVDAKTHRIISEKAVPFQKADGSSEDMELSSCIIHDIIPLKNNGMRILFESRLETTTSVYGVPVSREYSIGNIIIIDMDSSMNIVDLRKIKKEQHTNVSNYRYTGFAALTHNDKTFMVYNELANNLRVAPEKMKRLNSSRVDDAVVIYTTLENDKPKRVQLINKEKEESTDVIQPGSHLYDSSKSELFVLRERDNNYFLVRVEVDK